MDDNKMFAKPMYKCAVCDTVHDNILDRATCEMNCIKKLEEEAKKMAEEKKKAEQLIRKAEVDEAFDFATYLKDEYIKDYGSYIYSSCCDCDCEDKLDLFDLIHWFTM